jgi:aromatic-amino-acid transaminase
MAQSDDEAVLLHACCHNPTGIDYTLTAIGPRRSRGQRHLPDHRFRSPGLTAWKRDAVRCAPCSPPSLEACLPAATQELASTATASARVLREAKELDQLGTAFSNANVAGLRGMVDAARSRRCGGAIILRDADCSGWPSFDTPCARGCAPRAPAPMRAASVGRLTPLAARTALLDADLREEVATLRDDRIYMATRAASTSPG